MSKAPKPRRHRSEPDRARRDADGRAGAARAGRRGGRFDLAPTEDQEMIRATARRFADECRGLPRTRPMLPHDAAPTCSRARTELALAALVVPEAAGGIAETRASVTTVLAIEELARGDMGLALACSRRSASSTRSSTTARSRSRARWLPTFTGERFVPAALALLEAQARQRSGAAADRCGALRPAAGRSTARRRSFRSARPQSCSVVLAEIRGAGPRLFLVPKDTRGPHGRAAARDGSARGRPVHASRSTARSSRPTRCSAVKMRAFDADGRRSIARASRGARWPSAARAPSSTT